VTGIWIWGWHAVVGALNNSQRRLLKICVLDRHRAKVAEILAKTQHSRARIEYEILPQNIMDRRFGRNHQGIAVLVTDICFWNLGDWLRKQEADKVEKSVVIACDLLEDAHNLGAIIRTAAAFKASAVLVTKAKSVPIDGVVAKSAAGGLERIPIIKVANLSTALREFKENFYTVFGLDENGATKWEICQRAVIVLGQEGGGLRCLTKKNCDQILSIKTCKEFPTLNVSVAAGIAISRFLDY